MQLKFDAGFAKRRTLCNWVLGKNRTLVTAFSLHALKLGCLSCITDPLVHYGRHFGRTEHALCHIRTLLKNGLMNLRMAEPGPVDANDNVRTVRSVSFPDFRPAFVYWMIANAQER